MRSLVVVVFLGSVACKKDKAASPPPPPPAADAAPVAAATDAAPPPAPADATPAPEPSTTPTTATGPARFTGSYDVAFELPAKYKCEDDAAKVVPKQTFDVAVDSANADAFVVTGLDGGWEVTEDVSANDGGRIYLTLGNKADVDIEQVLILLVEGTQITGTVDVRPKYPDVDNPVCKPFLERVKVTGTRTPKP
jgi:hypothetical protein